MGKTVAIQTDSEHAWMTNRNTCGIPITQIEISKPLAIDLVYIGAYNRQGKKLKGGICLTEQEMNLLTEKWLVSQGYEVSKPDESDNDDHPEGANLCYEFTIKGVGWGRTIEEAWDACQEGIQLEKIDPEFMDPKPLLIDYEEDYEDDEEEDDEE